MQRYKKEINNARNQPFFFVLFSQTSTKTVQKNAIHLYHLFKKLVKYFYYYVIVYKIVLIERRTKVAQAITIIIIILIIKMIDSDGICH